MLVLLPAAAKLCFDALCIGAAGIVIAVCIVIAFGSITAIALLGAASLAGIRIRLEDEKKGRDASDTETR